MILMHSALITFSRGLCPFTLTVASKYSSASPVKDSLASTALPPAVAYARCIDIWTAHVSSEILFRTMHTCWSGSPNSNNKRSFNDLGPCHSSCGPPRAQSASREAYSEDDSMHVGTHLQKVLVNRGRLVARCLEHRLQGPNAPVIIILRHARHMLGLNAAQQ